MWKPLTLTDLSLTIIIFLIIFLCVCFFAKTGRGLTDNEVMAWRQLHLTAQQHKQILASPVATPQITTPIDNRRSCLWSLQDVMLKHQQRLEKRRLSENDLDRDIKLPKLSSIENNTCTSAALPLSLSGISLISGMRSHSEATNFYDKPFNALLSHREKAQHQQYLERLRRMNERTNVRERGSRVNFDQHNSAKTVREELANRKQQAKHGELKPLADNFSSANGNNFPPSFISRSSKPFTFNPHFRFFSLLLCNLNNIWNQNRIYFSFVWSRFQFTGRTSSETKAGRLKRW